jgi:hypothetical protein
MPGDIRTVINKLLYTPLGQKVVSAIFGLAIALLFHRVCKDNCTTYFAPYVNEIQGNIFRLEDTCYQYTPYMVNCNGNTKILNPYDINSKPENRLELTIKSNISDN